mgnify:CR=1 FL=1
MGLARRYFEKVAQCDDYLLYRDHRAGVCFDLDELLWNSDNRDVQGTTAQLMHEHAKQWLQLNPQ